MPTEPRLSPARRVLKVFEGDCDNNHENPDFGCGNGWLKIHFGGDCSGAEIGAEIGVTVKDFNGIGENRKNGPRFNKENSYEQSETCFDIKVF